MSPPPPAPAPPPAAPKRPEMKQAGSTDSLGFVPPPSKRPRQNNLNAADVRTEVYTFRENVLVADVMESCISIRGESKVRSMDLIPQENDSSIVEMVEFTGTGPQVQLALQLIQDFSREHGFCRD